MPLRSVEAASRDDAIAAAREQFGPHARVVGVRRVRSGGVLGFFATERYIAEVAPDQFARPGVPAPSTGSLPVTTAASYDSPLASAAPARARATAPSRNGAAAWAAEAARSSAGTTSSPGAGRTAAPRATGWAAPRPAVDDARLDELAGLLDAAPAAPVTEVPAAPVPSAPPAPAAPATGYGPASFPRATFPTATRATVPQAPRRTALPEPAAPDAEDATEAPAAPSPFTAALARMVSGDRDVRQAVAQALDEPAGLPADRDHDIPAARWDAPASRPSLAAALGSADTSMRSRAVHQEDPPVRDQADTCTTTTAGPLDLPAWADRPEVPEPSPSTRQEEIAEVLRSALAQGHSDDALAGILRKMLAGDSPQEVLAEPIAAESVPEPFVPEPVAVLPPASEPAAEPVVAELFMAEPVVAELSVDELFVDELFVDEPFVEPAAAEWFVAEPAAAESLLPGPATVESALPANHSLFGAPAPAVPAVPRETPVAPAASVTLWGEPLAGDEPAAAHADAPIWAEVALGDPAPSTLFGTGAAQAPVPASVESPAPADDAEPAVADEPAVAEVGAPAQPALDAASVTEPEELAELLAPLQLDEAAEAPVADAAEATEATEVTGVTGVTDVAEVAEVAPMLARTASDPAPMTMSLDATTVMPRISLLPPLPGSRGRGLPPVPPSSRPAVPPSARTPEDTTTSAPADTVDAVDGAETVDAPVPSPPVTRTLATVTRLPVGPLMASDDLPEAPELDDADEPATAPAPTAVGVRTPDEVVARLTALGVPQELLGDDVVARIEADGTYAALTRALADRLPEVPELPSGAGDVLFVVGPGVETLRAARSLSASLRLDPDRVQWATRGDLAGLAPKGSRMTTIDAAIDRRQEAASAGTVTIVAVDAPLRSDAYWMAQMLAIWAPVAVWAVVEATRKPEDLEVWLDGLARVDALIVQDTDLSADPAAVLQRLTVPVALLDGVRATPHRWASLLCERLDSPSA
ncbi:hypothetical protein [Blastococcus montanus]|uniref:hypothetical protein n=1 Tax=Blastococcus montanus TaxID=3144973 RepID=UPI00320B9348